MIKEATTASSSGQHNHPLSYISKRAWNADAEFDQLGMEREPGELVGVEVHTELPPEVDITKKPEMDIQVDYEEEPTHVMPDGTIMDGEEHEEDEEDDDITRILKLLNQSEE